MKTIKALKLWPINNNKVKKCIKANFFEVLVRKYLLYVFLPLYLEF